MHAPFPSASRASCWSFGRSVARGRAAGRSRTFASARAPPKAAADLAGAGSVQIGISDLGASGAGGVMVDTDTVSTTVAPVNDAPFARGQSVTTDEDAPVAVTLAATDVAGDALLHSVVVAPAHHGLRSVNVRQRWDHEQPPRSVTGTPGAQPDRSPPGRARLPLECLLEENRAVRDRMVRGAGTHPASPWATTRQKGYHMNVQMAFASLAMSLLLSGGLTGCDKPKPAETAGRKIDQASGEAEKKMGETADRVSQKVGEEGSRAGVAIQDTEITTKVKAAIFAEPGLRTLQISVDTVEGVVTLSGSVDSLASSKRAGELAGAVAGVRKVDNRLVPKSSR